MQCSAVSLLDLQCNCSEPCPGGSLEQLVIQGLDKSGSCKILFNKDCSVFPPMLLVPGL